MLNTILHKILKFISNVHSITLSKYKACLSIRQPTSSLCKQDKNPLSYTAETKENSFRVMLTAKYSVQRRNICRALQKPTFARGRKCIHKEGRGTGKGGEERDALLSHNNLVVLEENYASYVI